MMFAGVNPVTICNNGSNLVIDGNFAAVIADNTDPNWSLTRADDGSSFGYAQAADRGSLPPIGPQTYGNAAFYGATGTQEDTIAAAATIPTEVGREYILNFDLLISGSGADIDFIPFVGTPLTLIYPCNTCMPCANSTCPVTGTTDSNGYGFFSLSFIASSTSTPLSFAGRNGPSYSYLTNIAVCSFDNSTMTSTSS